MKGILLTSSFCLLHNVLVRADDILVHLSFHLFLYRRDSQHMLEIFILEGTVGDDDHIFTRTFGHGGQHRLINCLFPLGCSSGGR